MPSSAPGVLLREWRTRRRYSQLDLALAADVSAKHLSYIETGRSRPSPEMIVHLCDHLDVPLRGRNDILVAAGFAPRYGDTTYDATDGQLRAAVDTIVAANPYPTVVVDRHWNLVTANPSAGVFLAGVAEHLLAPPANVIRISLHPDGLAPRIVNFTDYTAHVLRRVRRAASVGTSATLGTILEDYAPLTGGDGDDRPSLLLTMDLDTPAGVIRFFSTITTFGSPYDATLEELALETFYPADPTSRRRLADLTDAE